MREMRWIWIGRAEETNQTFLHHPEVRKLDTQICEIVKHPCPCFPKTMLDSESGQQRIMEVELGDVFPPEVWKRQISQPASVGALHSHRRAWHVAETYSATAWAMFIEDDINPTANAADRVRLVFDFIQSDLSQYHMVNFVMGASPYMINLAEKYSKRVHKDGRHVEIRTCPMRPTRGNQPLALHVGLGLKWYALSGPARRFLLAQMMQCEAYELFLMGLLVNTDHFRSTLPHKTYHRAENRVLYVTPTCGEHARDFDDFFIGSGRYKRDSGHDAGPYVMVTIPPTTRLIPRLHMVAFGAELARMVRIGLVIHWPTSHANCKLWFQDMFRWTENISRHGIAFIRVLAQDKGGTVTYYTKAADPKRYRLIVLDFELDYLHAIRGLLQTPDVGFSHRLKDILKTGLMAQELELQPWCHHAARDWICENDLEGLLNPGDIQSQCGLHLWSPGDQNDESEFRSGSYNTTMSWMDYIVLTLDDMAVAVANHERVVFLTDEFAYLKPNGFVPFLDLAKENTDSGLVVTWPSICDLDTMGQDEYYQTECTATYMALLQQINLTHFPKVSTYLHGHILWADITRCKAENLVDWLCNSANFPEGPFQSFAGINRAMTMKPEISTPPWNKQKESVTTNSKLDDLWIQLKSSLPDYIAMNDTVSKYITRAQYGVLLELRDATLEMVDRHLRHSITTDTHQRMSMQSLGTWAQNQKDLASNKTKYRDTALPSEPRTAWPWLTALVLVTLNQYRMRAGNNPYQIHATYVTETTQWNGDLEALYDSRGPGGVVSAGLYPKTGGCPSRR